MLFNCLITETVYHLWETLVIILFGNRISTRVINKYSYPLLLRIILSKELRRKEIIPAESLAKPNSYLTRGQARCEVLTQKNKAHTGTGTL